MVRTVQYVFFWDKVQKWITHWYTHISTVYGDALFFKSALLCAHMRACGLQEGRTVTESPLTGSPPFPHCSPEVLASSLQAVNLPPSPFYVCPFPALQRVLDSLLLSLGWSSVKEVQTKTELLHKEKWGTASVHHFKYTTSDITHALVH